MAIDRTFVFKDDLIASSSKTLWNIKRMSKRRKGLNKIKDFTKLKENYMYLNSKHDRRKSKRTSQKSSTLGKDDQIIFVGIHSRLVFPLLIR